MKDLRSKKAIAASLSLTLALGSVPAVALADDADENSEGAASEQSTQAELSFSANGGQFTDGSTGVTIKANEDGSINAPTPTRAGYTFKGWYSQSNMDGIPENYQQYYKLDLSSAKAGSWFAAWEKNAEVQAQSVEVVSFFQGGERDGSSVTTTIDVAADSSVADCVKSFEGYTPTKVVSGAATSEQEVNMTSSLEGISTLYVYYKADEQKAADKVDFDQAVTGQTVTMFAQWTKDEVQNETDVLYVANGGKFFDGQEVQQGLTDSDGMMRQPMTPTRDGYTFAGWYWVSDLSVLTEEQKEQNKVDFGQPVTKPHVTMYAQWVKNQDEINVLYAANGGQFADGNDTMQGVADSDGVMRQPAAPTREGYTFAGWYWVSDLSGLTDEQKDLNKVDFSQSVAGKEHVTVFAQWTKNQEQNDHAVMYVANGGQFATGETFQQGVTDSDGMMRQPAEPTREGYTFDGWYWHADYSGYTDEQKAADKVDFSQPVQSDVNIYAQWTKNADAQAEQITVKFVDNFNGTESSAEVKKGEAVAKPADPTYDGWTFEGWSSTLKDDEGNWEYTPVDFSKAVEDEDQDGVVTYYAFYSENQAAADDAANGEEAAEQEAAGDDAEAADESSIAPQTGDATNVAAVAGIGGIAGLLAAAAALLRRRRSN